MSTFNISIETATLNEIVFLGLIGFLVSMALTPIYTTIAYKYQWWKKPRTTTLTGEKATEFQKLHAAKHRRNIPTMAGIITLVGVALVTLIFNLSREQTWLPLALMAAAGVVGLVDDYINIKGDGKGVAGLRAKLKFTLIGTVAFVGGWWFFAKNDITSFYMPGLGDVTIGWLMIPLFMLVVIATANAVNISDGLDGLAGGLLASSFGTYAVIAFLQERYGVAAFCMTIVGSLLAYIWFNIYPARFFMGDVGSFSLGTALGVVAMITDTLVLLPIIGLVFVAEAGSVILQTISKKTRNGKKIFRISPIHHHFEAIGWPETKVTMRFWVIGQVAAVIGLVIAILGGICMNPRIARNAQDQSPTARKHRPDYGLFITASILSAVGLIVMYAISPALAAQGGDVSDNYFVIRQFIAVVIGIGAFYIFSKVPATAWGKWHKALIISAIVLSLGTIVTGGLANRWIQLGAFSFQTVEYVKLIVVIVFAGFLAQVAEQGRLTDVHAWKIPAIIAATLGFIVVIIQRDLGSAVVLFAIMLSMLYMAGFPVGKIVLVGTIIGVLGLLAIVSTPYRRDRVATFLNPTQDCSDTGYHSCQALIAVGSGGVMGVGLGRSIQAYGYLPEAENDSIFAIYAEKFGFIGSVALLGLYGSLLLRILNIMQRAPNRTMQLMTAGVFTWFAVQGTINIAAMLGLIPLKGITLPFISYGGTSLIFSMAALGLVFHISKYTLMRKTTFALPVREGGTSEDSRHWRRDSRPRYTVTRRSL